MGFPRKLKQMTSIVEGIGYAGETTSVTLPNLERKLEAYRGGGMNRPVKIDMGGGDDLNLEHSYGGPILDIVRQFGSPTMTGVQVRFVGSYENDDTGEITTVEIVVRGRHETIDRGEQKPGESGEFKVVTACAYYKEIWNGVTEVEIDIPGMVEIVGGIDLMAAHRSALGMF
ncbi:phage major tail tube protein [Sphingomonas sp. LT1P40]|uniref:phage major tail tube protein n=1 Tax=Alteristakelama amylovorans TaxID=3096166 RepID=UPI002FC6CC38